MSKSLIFIFAVFLLGAAAWLLTFRIGTPGPIQAGAAPVPTAAFRLGVIPEKDVYQQRKAYRELGDYLAKKGALASGGGRIELVTASSYEGVLKDFEEHQVDGAFVGSLVAVLAADRYGAQVVLKSESLSGNSMYSGVVFVREDSPAKSFADLAGKRLGGVRTTTAGAVYPEFLLSQAAATMPSLTPPTLVWSGTHDDVIRDVLFNLVDAGAVKDTRLAAYQRAHPEAKLRRLGESPRVPDNALILRKGLPAEQQKALVAALLAMNSDPDAKEVLATLELNRFLPCELKEYAGLYEMIRTMGPAWAGIDLGPAPTLHTATVPLGTTAVGGGN